MNTVCFAIPLLLLSALARPVSAGEFYLLGAGGQSHIKVEQGTIDNALRRAGATNVVSSKDSSDTAYKIQFGYQFNQHFAIEGGYVDLGKATYKATFDQGSATGSIKARGPNIGFLGSIPATDSLSIFLKLGAINATAETKLDSVGIAAAIQKTLIRPNVGIGANYAINDSLSARVEYEQFYGIGDDKGGTKKIAFGSIGLTFKF